MALLYHNIDLLHKLSQPLMLCYDQSVSCLGAERSKYNCLRVALGSMPESSLFDNEIGPLS